MQVKKLIPALGMALLLSACSSTKDINYFQDLKPGQEIQIAASEQLKLRTNDKISIIVSTSDARLNSLFNLPVANNRVGGSTNGSGSISTDSGNGNVATYTIDSQGDVQFPVLGRLHISGMTREQVAEYVRSELVSRDLAKSPIVTVDFLNLGVSVLGDISSPGRVYIPREDFTILDVIAASGDLQITGQRRNVKVIRTENGVQKVYEIDLTNDRDIVNSPAYYVQQNDVVYVEPNAVKARTSTANGNTWLTPSFWISMITFAITIGTLIWKL
jgi:polysaccharide export outer membrane protein